jgi:hypothetical protein
MKCLIYANAAQRGAIQHRGMSGPMPHQNRPVNRNKVEILPGWMPFLHEKELIVAIAAFPFSPRNPREMGFQSLLYFRDRASRAEINATESARPGKKMQMGINETGKNSFSRTGKELCMRRTECFKFGICADSQNLTVGYGNCLCFGTLWVERKYMTAVEQQIRGKRRHAEKIKK